MPVSVPSVIIFFVSPLSMSLMANRIDLVRLVSTGFAAVSSVALRRLRVMHPVRHSGRLFGLRSLRLLQPLSGPVLLLFGRCRPLLGRVLLSSPSADRHQAASSSLSADRHLFRPIWSLRRFIWPSVWSLSDFCSVDACSVSIAVLAAVWLCLFGRLFIFVQLSSGLFIGFRPSESASVSPAPVSGFLHHVVSSDFSFSGYVVSVSLSPSGFASRLYRPPISSGRLSDPVRSFVFPAVSVWLDVSFRDFISIPIHHCRHSAVSCCRCRRCPHWSGRIYMYL